MKYGLIYADPPWQYDNSSSRAAAENHYSTMSLTDLKRLPVWDLAADNCVLAMWWVPPMPVEAIELAQAWGFRVKNMCMFTWAKLNTLAEQRIDKALGDDERSVYDFYGFLDLLNAETRMGMGNYTRGNAESVLVAVRGRGLERISASIKQMVHAPVGEHSAKPAEVRHRLDKLYGDVPRIELFSRGDADGWDHWGNEAPTRSLSVRPASLSGGAMTPEQNNALRAVARRCNEEIKSAIKANPKQTATTSADQLFRLTISGSLRRTGWSICCGASVY